ncbi:MAG: glycosyltransferase family 4 protein [Planctomycetia bacterium]
MKVAHIIAGLNVGGAELMLRRLVLQHGTTFGGQHLVISLTDVGTIGKQLAEDGVMVLGLGLRQPASAPIVLYRLYRLLKRTQPDVVQTWMYHADLLGGVTARLAGIRTVIWGIRSTDIRKGGSPVTRLVRWACARVSRYIPRSIVCAAEESRRVHLALGYHPNAMTVIPNGFDFPALQAKPHEAEDVRRGLGLEAGTVLVGTVGRFNRVKGIDIFVTAAGLIAAKHPGVHFLLAGRGMDFKNPVLASLIAATGCAERFHLLGERDDVPACLSALDVYCMPSRSEGFPNVVGEAMAVGTPCVVTRVGDAACLIGEHGFVVAPEKPTALAEGLLRMLELPSNMRREMGRAAQERLRDEFSMVKCASGFDRVYREAICHGEKTR